jgi:hypothetical protein
LGDMCNFAHGEGELRAWSYSGRRQSTHRTKRSRDEEERRTMRRDRGGDEEEDHDEADREKRSLLSPHRPRKEERRQEEEEDMMLAPLLPPPPPLLLPRLTASADDVQMAIGVLRTCSAVGADRECVMPGWMACSPQDKASLYPWLCMACFEENVVEVVSILEKIARRKKKATAEEVQPPSIV